MKPKTFGDRLRELRLQQEEYTSLRHFAAGVGLSPTYLSHLENNKVPPPSEAVIEKLAEALKADKYELFSLADKIPPEFMAPFKKNPQGFAIFMRKAREAGITSDRDWETLGREINRIHKKSKARDRR
jgi:transcriptional regulator with XRE-family HTH domain